MQTPTSSLADVPPTSEEALHKRRRLLSGGAEELHPGAGWEIYQVWREKNKRLFGRQMQHCGIQFGLAGRACRSRTCRSSGEATYRAACPDEPCGYGSWWPKGQVITLCRRLLHRHGRVWRLYHERLGGRFAEDVLLHQMMHQYIGAVRRAGSQSAEDPGLRDESSEGTGLDRSLEGSPHNNSLWIGEVNRLSEALETTGGTVAALPEDESNGGTPDGILSPRETALWPYLSRPEGYYEADPEAVFAEELPQFG
ncbi:hypothetical protein GGP49_002970 [Salinibacter ruber]|uniref:hypothetical protein n=1 Tax=Salinibacter ruber TaxID=146919 RepID=UPI00216942AE|nr:hypothetical protein [Salinibacter ruber]MCS4116020.1 hypothetical protein [Salinibacter ruber]